MKSPGVGTARRALVFVCGVVPVLLTAVLAVYRPAFFPRLDDSVYDALLRSVHPLRPGNGVVIVDVDEQSLSMIGQWPWRRDVVGQLIGRLREMGASVVALDIIFAETDRYERSDEPVAHATLDPKKGSDDLLAATLQDGRVVLGYALTFEKPRPHACVLHPVNFAVIDADEEGNHTPYFRATSAVCSLPKLAAAAGRSGFLNAAPDSDGVLRRVPLVAELDGRVYPGLAVAAVMANTGSHDLTLRVSNVNAASLSIGQQVVPVDGKSNLLVRYRGKKKTFPYVSAVDVMNRHAPPESVRNKIVFVGTTALGTREVVATPLDTLFAGVEVQATVADNLLEQTFLKRPGMAAAIETQLVLLLGIAMAIVVSRIGIISGVLACGISLGVLWTAALWGVSKGTFVSPLFPTLGVASALSAMTFGKFFVERRRADRAGREKTAAQGLMVQTLLSLTETRDAETGRHSRRTQQYARVLAEALATGSDYRDYLTPERIDLLSSLAPLHDIGKVGIPDHILNKPGALTPEELAAMRNHPALGRDVILKAEQRVGVRDDATLAMAKDIVYTHHEKWDGTGYPQGLQGTEIPIAGRVMAIVDVYDAAVSRSLYRPALTHHNTVDLIVRGRGTHFDPVVVDAFVSVADRIKQLTHGADS